MHAQITPKNLIFDAVIMLTEDKLISFLQRQFTVTGGIGDDAAILPFKNSTYYLISKDILIEDVHFRSSYFSAKDLALKSLAVNMSDIAAMGGKNKYIFLGISLPQNKLSYGKKFLNYFTRECKKEKIILLGGDTTKSTNKIFISITIIGIAKKNNIKKRYHASVDDIICIAGNLGHSHVGFTALENNLSGFENYKNIFLRPRPKLNEGIFLGSQKCITSMMDLSDGLTTDLTRLTRASKKSALIDLNIIKIDKNFNVACNKLYLNPLITTLTGGEDYGLLFTVKKNSYLKLANNFKKKFGYELQTIGKIIKKNKTSISFFQDNKFIKIKLKSFEHFL